MHKPHFLIISPRLDNAYLLKAGPALLLPSVSLFCFRSQTLAPEMCRSACLLSLWLNSF